MILFKTFKNLLWLVPFFCFFIGYYILRSFLHKKEFTIPNLTGKTLQNGIITLSSCGLNLRLAREKEDTDLPEGTILEQIPSSVEPIRLNQTIFVTISKKPKPELTPDFLGMTYKDILIKSRKLNIQPIITWLQSNCPKESCISQFPWPGQSMQQKDLVIYLSLGGCNMFIVPNLKGQMLSKVEEALNKYNISLDIVGKDNLRLETNRTIVDQKPMFGSIIDLNKKLHMQLLVK